MSGDDLSVVTFRGPDGRLARSVVDHVADGVREHEGILIDLPEDDLEGLTDRLKSRDIDLLDLRGRGRLVVVDWWEDLHDASAKGPLDASVLEARLEEDWRRASDNGVRSVRAVIGTVDTLWLAGHHGKAMQVEAAWRRVVARRRIKALMSYGFRRDEELRHQVDAAVGQADDEPPQR